MSIKNDVIELQAVRQEMKRKREELKKWREKEKQLCAKISSYLQAKNLPGVKFEGVAIVNEEKETRKPKPKKEGLTASLDVLKKYVNDPEKVLQEIAEAKKGDEVVKQSIKIQKVKVN